MKKEKTGKGLMLIGSLRTSGMTTYMKQGKMITRASHSNEKRSNTYGQFVQRQKMRHAVALWKMLKFCETMFTERPTAYNNFMSLANRLPTVYVSKGLMDHASFLMPGIPVSDGKLPMVNQQLDEVDGVAALMTDLKADEWTSQEKLCLYTAEQDIEHGMPRVRFCMRVVSRQEMTVVGGHLALVDEAFADEMKGWALVRVLNGRCSPQVIVTRCTFYEQYTTDKALQTATKSYGGLT
jgi:hypothetical protein